MYRQELQNCFDEKVDQILALLDGHIRHMYSKYPDDQIVSSTAFVSNPITDLLFWIDIHDSFGRIRQLPIRETTVVG